MDDVDMVYETITLTIPRDANCEEPVESWDWQALLDTLEPPVVQSEQTVW